MPWPNGGPETRSTESLGQQTNLSPAISKNNVLQAHNTNFSLSNEQLQAALDAGQQPLDQKKEFIIQLIATKGDTWFDNFRFGSNQEKNNANLSKLLAYAFKKDLNKGEFKDLCEAKLAKFNNPTQDMSPMQNLLYIGFDNEIQGNQTLQAKRQEFQQTQGQTIQGDNRQKAAFVMEFFDQNGDVKKGKVENYQDVTKEIKEKTQNEKIWELINYVKAKNTELLANQEFSQELQAFENNPELIKDPAMEQKVAQLNQQQGLTGEQAITVRDIMMGEMILQNQDKYANLVDDEYLQNITAIRESMNLAPSTMPHVDLMERSAATQPAELNMSNIDNNAHMIQGLEQTIQQTPNNFQTPEALEKAVDVEDPTIFTNFLPNITNGIPENFAERLNNHFQDNEIIAQKESMIAHYQYLEMAINNPQALATTLQQTRSIPDSEKQNAINYYTTMQPEQLQNEYLKAQNQAAFIVKEMMLPVTNNIFKQESVAGFLDNVSDYFADIGSDFVLLDGQGATMTPEGGLQVELAVKDVNGQLPLDENGNPTASTKVVFGPDGSASIVDPLGGDMGYISYEMKQILEGIPTAKDINNPQGIRMDRVLEKAGNGYGNKKREAMESLMGKAVKNHADSLHKSNAAEVKSQIHYHLNKIRTQDQCMQIAMKQRWLTAMEANQPGPYQTFAQRFSYKKFKEGGNPPQLSASDPEFASFYRMAKIIDRTTDNMSANEQKNLIQQLKNLQDGIAKRASSQQDEALNKDPLMRGIVSQEARKKASAFPNLIDMMCRDKNDRTKTVEPQLIQATTELITNRDPARPDRPLFERPAFNVIKGYPNALDKIEHNYRDVIEQNHELADNWVEQELDNLGETETDNIYKQFSQPA